jgi:hypothetical protein
MLLFIAPRKWGVIGSAVHHQEKTMEFMIHGRQAKYGPTLLLNVLSQVQNWIHEQ